MKKKNTNTTENKANNTKKSNKKYYIGGAILGILGVGFAVAKLRKKNTDGDDVTPPPAPTPVPNPDQNTTSTDLIISNLDANYEYKRSGGVWYTRKKGAAAWINMRTALTPELYNRAMATIQVYMTQKGLK